MTADKKRIKYLEKLLLETFEVFTMAAVRRTDRVKNILTKLSDELIQIRERDE